MVNISASTPSQTQESSKSELNTDVIELPQGVGVNIRDSQGNLLANIVCNYAVEGLAHLLVTHPVDPPLITVVIE